MPSADTVQTWQRRRDRRQIRGGRRLRGGAVGVTSDGSQVSFFFFLRDKNTLEVDRGDGCTEWGMHATPSSCAHENDSSAEFCFTDCISIKSASNICPQGAGPGVGQELEAPAKAGALLERASHPPPGPDPELLPEQASRCCVLGPGSWTQALCVNCPGLVHTHARTKSQ